MESIDIYGNTVKIENKFVVITDNIDQDGVNALCADGWIVVSVTSTNTQFAVLLQKQTIIKTVPVDAPGPFADMEDDGSN